MAGRLSQGRAGTDRGSDCRGQVVSQPVTRTLDVYLDTEDWRIGRFRFRLACPHHDDDGEVTLKDTSPAIAGLRRRIEVSEPLPLTASTPWVLTDRWPPSSGPGGGRPPGPSPGSEDAPSSLPSARRRRVPREVDLDDTIIWWATTSIRRCEGSKSKPSRSGSNLTPLVDQLRGTAVSNRLLSKFEVGLLAAGIKVRQPRPGSHDLGAEPSVGSVAYAVLRRHLASCCPRGRYGWGRRRALHDMRWPPDDCGRSGAVRGCCRAMHGGCEMRWVGWRPSSEPCGIWNVQLERLDSWRHELPPEDGGALIDLAASSVGTPWRPGGSAQLPRFTAL